GGGRSSPSAKTSSRSACAVRTGWRTGRADISGGVAWVVADAHIAITGQSVHVLLFCSSGQHGISAAIDAPSALGDILAIDDMSVISAAMAACMIGACIAAGAATGATASPA